MHPDLVMGLRRTERFRGYLSSNPLDLPHCPVANSKILYPFMVFEAKREGYRDGFRGIEDQTAFPLYRLLKVQDRLRNASRSTFDPLVWFFGYQGDVWRLYAAILDGSRVVSDIFFEVEAELAWIRV
jgi:hypothetical protein